MNTSAPIRAPLRMRADMANSVPEGVGVSDMAATLVAGAFTNVADVSNGGTM